MVTDTSIAEKVDRALRNDDMLRSTDYTEINVAVAGGIVSLRGHVINTNNQRQAEAAARAVPGVRDVINDLVSDEKIIREVALALAQIAYAYGDRIFTGAQNGVVFLTGEVSSAAKRTLAEKCATSIPVVRGVMNTIRAPGVDPATEDQRFLQPSIGEPIYFRDNLLVKIQRVIINPNNRRVVAMIVRGRFPDKQQNFTPQAYGDIPQAERLVVISMRAIRYLTKSSGFLELDSAEVDKYKDFVPADFVEPQAKWVPPYPYSRDEVLFPIESVEEVKQPDRGVASLPVEFPWDKLEMQASTVVQARSIRAGKFQVL